MATSSKDPSGELNHSANEPTIPRNADFDIDRIKVIVTRAGDDELVELTLRIRLLRNHQQLFFQLSSDSLPLHPQGSKKAANARFYLFILPSNLLNVRLADGQYSTVLRHDTYQLHVALKTPPELVGPKLDEGHTNWKGKNPSAAKTLASLEALAGVCDFTIALPVSAAARANVASFCKAVSPADGLQPLPSAYNPANLYAGKGGHKYVPADDDAHSEPASKPAGLPPYAQAGSYPPAYDGSAAKRDSMYARRHFPACRLTVTRSTAWRKASADEFYVK